MSDKSKIEGEMMNASEAQEFDLQFRLGVYYHEGYKQGVEDSVDKMSFKYHRMREALKEALAEIETLTDESVMEVDRKAQHRLWMERMRSLIINTAFAGV
jgi:uncharacterized protein (DUF2164 family)